MLTSSHFSNETESAMDPPMAAGNELEEWGWMEAGNQYVGEVPTRVKWWKRPRIFYPTLCLIVLSMIALAATAVVMGMNGISGWRPNQQANAGTDQPADDGGNVQGSANGTSPTLAPTAVATAPPTTSAPTKQPTVGAPRVTPFSFYVMGDVPYAPWEERVLMEQIANLTQNRHPGSAFICHVGDMMKAERTGCQQNYFLHVKNILSQGPLPTFVLAGDNDSLDCVYPDQAWEYYTSTFSDFDEEWSFRLPAGVPELGVERWLLPVNVPVAHNMSRWTTRPEMFSFMEDGVLFMSMTLMHVPDDQPPDAQFQERLADSKTWVTQQLTKTMTTMQQRSEPLRGVVMFGHARIAGYLRPYFMELKQIFYDAFVYVPVLYMHGDGHKFGINEKFGPNIGWNQFVDIQVDQGAYADPLLVEVAMSQYGLMQSLTVDNANQFIVGNGLFRIDRQKGRYTSIEDEDV